MMIPELSAQQMVKVDDLMTNTYHIHLLQMMENAGRLLAKFAVDFFKPKVVTILVGKGNTGGGGLVAARYLHKQGIKVHLILVEPSLKETPSIYFKTCQQMALPIVTDINAHTDLIIDALLGYNAVGEPRDEIKPIMQTAIDSARPVLCLDSPTGYDLNQNIWHDPSFQDSTVLTLGLPKTGMLSNPKIKALYLADIGIPDELYRHLDIELLEPLFKKGEIIRLK